MVPSSYAYVTRAFRGFVPVSFPFKAKHFYSLDFFPKYEHVMSGFFISTKGQVFIEFLPYYLLALFELGKKVHS